VVKKIENRLLIIGIKKFIFSAIGLALLYASSLYSYLLFHSLIEIITIVIGCTIFVLAWNSRQRLDNHYLLFLGIAFLFISLIDLIHTLAYKNMGVFTGFDANLPTQLWIAARSLQSVTLLTALLFLRRKINAHFALIGYTLVTTGLLASIFYRVFPVCFIEGVGLTQFKIVSEYTISGILLLSTVLFFVYRSNFERKIVTWLIISFLFTIASEWSLRIMPSVFISISSTEPVALLVDRRQIHELVLGVISLLVLGTVAWQYDPNSNL
jgi:hypothetical protein